MKRLAIALLIVTGCADDPPPPITPATPPAAVPSVSPSAEAPADPSLGLPGEIYKRAYEHAKKEITPENAHERLKILEREIELDRQREPSP